MAGYSNVTFQKGDIYHTGFLKGSFDNIFLYFVLEHLHDPISALTHLISLLVPGGTITVIEGDHGSTSLYPRSAAADETIQKLIDMQAEKGGKALIGCELYPLLSTIGLSDLFVEPLMVYVDASRPDIVEGFIEKTFIAMIEGVREEALMSGRISKERWDEGIGDCEGRKRRTGHSAIRFSGPLARC